MAEVRYLDKETGDDFKAALDQALSNAGEAAAGKHGVDAPAEGVRVDAPAEGVMGSEMVMLPPPDDGPDDGPNDGPNDGPDDGPNDGPDDPDDDSPDSDGFF